MEYKSPDWFTKSLKSLLNGLLKKNPLSRLGSQKMGGI